MDIVDENKVAAEGIILTGSQYRHWRARNWMMRSMEKLIQPILATCDLRTPSTSVLSRGEDGSISTPMPGVLTVSNRCRHVQ